MKKRIEEINRRKIKNFEAFRYIAYYLNNMPNLVDKEIIEHITGGNKENEERVFISFLANVYSEDVKKARLLEGEYLSRGVKLLDPAVYFENPYVKNVTIPRIKEGNWELGYQSYAPYEGFIYRDIECVGDYVEIPQVGFFSEKFSFPTVFEDGREWMAIKPNEIETMKLPIEKAWGRVLVCGLGMGYFAYMVSQKDTVTSVTVVERDQSVINLFENHILPQFPNKGKITVIKSDAFEYAENEMKKGGYDYVFTDLWHDVSDGVDLYVKMKKHEALCPNSHFEYWIERSILSIIRWSVFEGIYEKVKKETFNGTVQEVERYLTDDYLKQFVKFI